MKLSPITFDFPLDLINTYYFDYYFDFSLWPNVSS